VEIAQITPEQAQAFLESEVAANEIDPSFLQTPAWAQVKAGWGSKVIGFYEAGKLIGSALVLARKIPKLNRYFLYIPEGPALAAKYLEQAIPLLREYAISQNGFALRIGPMVIKNRWDSETIKEALADESKKSLQQVTPSWINSGANEIENILRSNGFNPSVDDVNGFAAGQPKYIYQLALTGKGEADVLAGFNQLWRRNIKKGEKENVEITRGSRADLAKFHKVYLETATRDHFTPRPLSYFEKMWDAMRKNNENNFTLFLAKWNDTIIAATILVTLNKHSWYLYGASSAYGREARGSNVLQWAMMQQSLNSHCDIYDLRGITSTVDQNDAHAGLIQFKVGVGGYATELIGEWDLPLNKLLYRAFRAYLNRK
jgi:lipid II:glycine glycyltransferase (peptidoglycan interpeptide bridge formation enzyme)